MGLTITQDGSVSTTGAFNQPENIAPKPSQIVAVPDLPFDTVQRGSLGGVLYLCDSDVSIGTLVQGGVAPNRYVLPVTGETIGPVLGVVVSKPRSIVAEVLQLGIAPVFANLSVGSRYFVSNGGALITAPLPANDPLYVHYVGTAVATDTLLLHPSYPLVKRVFDA